MGLMKRSKMKRLIIILLTLFWFGCEDKKEKDSNHLKGIWEMDMIYNFDDSTFVEVDEIFWYIELDLEFRERYINYVGTDTACFTDWENEQVFQLFDPDSGTVLWLAGGGVIRVGLKVENERLNISVEDDGIIAKGIKSTTSDFTPLCE